MTAAKVGARPGTLEIPPGSPAPRIHVIRYGEGQLDEQADVRPSELAGLVGEGVTWIDVQGLGDAAVLEEIARIFDLHPIELENAVNVPQRAKSEVYGERHLTVARVPAEACPGAKVPPQVSIIAGSSFVLTFQERYLGLFDVVRERIRGGNTRITTLGTGYLCYALVDAVVDHYFPSVDEINDRIDALEDEVLAGASRDVIGELHGLRRRLAVIRRVGAPQHDAIASMLREPSPVLADETRSFLRDTLDHMAQVLGRVESATEAARSLGELYLSEVSFRTNEIMKVLTLMASIFIPLTFIAGIYGMNFEVMPELRKPWAYPMVLGTMVAVGVGMLWYFRRRGWIGGPPRSRDD